MEFDEDQDDDDGGDKTRCEGEDDDDDDDNTLIEGIQLPPGHEPGDHFQLRPHSHHLPYRKMLEPA